MTQIAAGGPAVSFSTRARGPYSGPVTAWSVPDTTEVAILQGGVEQHVSIRGGSLAERVKLAGTLRLGVGSDAQVCIAHDGGTASVGGDADSHGAFALATGPNATASALGFRSVAEASNAYPSSRVKVTARGSHALASGLSLGENSSVESTAVDQARAAAIANGQCSAAEVTCEGNGAEATVRALGLGSHVRVATYKPKQVDVTAAETYEKIVMTPGFGDTEGWCAHQDISGDSRAVVIFDRPGGDLRNWAEDDIFYSVESEGSTKSSRVVSETNSMVTSIVPLR